MFKRIIYIYGIFSLLTVGAICGQPTDSSSRSEYPPIGEKWTLAECIDYALENNIDLKKQELNIETETINKQQTRLNFIPDVSVGGSYSYNFGRASDPTTNIFNTDFYSVSASASVGTTLFAGLYNHHAMRAADLTLQNTLLSLDKARNDLSLQITAAYMDILLVKDNVSILETSMETLRLQLSDTEKTVEAGKSTIAVLLQMKSDYANAEYELISYRNNLTLAYLRLCQLLEIADYESFEIVSPDEFSANMESLPADREQILDMAMSLPEIQSSELDIALAERNIKIAKSSYWPRVSLSIGYGSSFSNSQRGNNISDQIQDNKGGSLGLSLSIPIFSSLQVRNNVKKSKISYRMAEYNYRSAIKQLNSDVENAYIEAQGALAQYDSSQRNIATNEEAFRVIQEKFRLGAATPVEYTLALENLTRARTQFAQAKYTYIFKLKILDFYMGVPLNSR